MRGLIVNDSKRKKSEKSGKSKEEMTGPSVKGRR